jgi:hypothetical protein
VSPNQAAFTDKKDLLEQLQEANRWIIIERQLVKACRFFGGCYNNIINDNNTIMNLMNKQTPVMI